MVQLKRLKGKNIRLFGTDTVYCRTIVFTYSIYAPPSLVETNPMLAKGGTCESLGMGTEYKAKMDDR